MFDDDPAQRPDETYEQYIARRVAARRGATTAGEPITQAGLPTVTTLAALHAEALILDAHIERIRADVEQDAEHWLTLVIEQPKNLDWTGFHPGPIPR